MEEPEVSNNSHPDKNTPTGGSFVITVVLIVIVLAVGVLSVYFANFNGEFGTQSDFGAFGDFLGGILNPILSFATLSLLIWSINIQIRELKATTFEFKRSAAAQQEIDKNQKQELKFYQNKGEVELILNELKRLEGAKQQILEGSYTNYPIHDLLIYGKVDYIIHFKKLMSGFDYNSPKQDEDGLPIVNLINDLISYTNDYDYYLEKLFVRKEYELYVMKVYSFSSFLENLTALKLGTKLQLNGLAKRIDTRNVTLPDLKDDRLNGLKTFVAEKVINIYKLTNVIQW
jgi:uncharacterized membrane protein